jgi:hypothetical protein
VEATFLFGRTQYGLGYVHGTLGAAFGARMDAWVFGVTPYFGYLSISRLTRPDSLDGGTLGLSLHASWDFVSWRRSAFFLLGRVTGEIGALPIVGGGLSVGYRFGP